MKSRDLLSVFLHRPEVLCRALVDPLLPDGDGLELAGGYNGWSWLVRTQGVDEWIERSPPAVAVWLLKRFWLRKTREDYFELSHQAGGSPNCRLVKRALPNSLGARKIVTLYPLGAWSSRVC
jgi:hypothetical protein